MTIFTTSHYHSDNLLTSDCQSALHKNNNARLFIRHCLGYIYHRLRGSASTVWTATSQVNGRWQILTSHRIETHELQQNSAQLITSARGPPKPNLVQIHPLGASGHTGEIERFCAFFIYLYLFSETRIQVRPVDGFLRAIAHRCEITQGCAFSGL